MIASVRCNTKIVAYFTSYAARRVALCFVYYIYRVDNVMFCPHSMALISVPLKQSLPRALNVGHLGDGYLEVEARALVECTETLILYFSIHPLFD